jgi:hypothetical protein
LLSASVVVDRWPLAVEIGVVKVNTRIDNRHLNLFRAQGVGGFKGLVGADVSQVVLVVLDCGVVSAIADEACFR